MKKKGLKMVGTVIRTGSFPIVLLTFIVLCFPVSLRALTADRSFNQFIVDHWTSNNGLPQNTAEVIVQTRNGFLWIGTEEGFVRFDGVHFTVYDSSVLPLPEHQVLSITEDSKEPVIWVGFLKGVLLKFNYKDGSYTIYTPKDGLPDSSIIKIILNADNSLWLATNGAGITRFYPGKKVIVYDKSKGLESNTVNDMIVDSQHHLWFTAGKTLYSLVDNRLTPVVTSPEKSFSKIYFDHKGRLFAGTIGDGVFVVNRNEHSLTPFQDEVLGGEMIGSIAQDREGNFYIGTYENGVFRVRNHGEADISIDDLLSINYAVSFLGDAEGSLWIGTRGYGLWRLKAGKFVVFGSKSGFKQSVIFPVMELNDGAILAGTWAGGLYRMKRRKFRQVLFPPILTGKTTVLSFAQAADNSLWVSAYGKGVVRIGENKETRLYTTDDGLSGNIVSVIYPDSANRMWFGGFKGVLQELDPKTGNIVSFGKNAGLDGSSIRCITEDFAHNIMVATQRGAFIKRGDRFARLTSNFPSINVESIRPVSSRRIYLATDKGLFIKEGNSLFTIGRSEGLPLSSLFDVITDNAHNLWMTSNKGIVLLKKQEVDDFIAGKTKSVTVEKYGTSDGLVTPECDGGTQPNTWRSRDGKIWFATAKGVAVVDPANMKKNTVVPPVEILSLKVDDDKPIEYVESGISLKPGITSLQINYTGLSLLFPQKVSFIYRLKGLSNKWVNAGDRRYAIYTSLAPGDYTFEVKAANNDGVWSEHAATLSFSVKPFFYQTIWFKLLVLFGFIFVIIYLVRHKLTAMKERERILAMLVDDKTKDLREIIRHIRKMSGKLREISVTLNTSMGETHQAFNLSKSMITEASSSLSDITGKLTNTKNDVLEMRSVVSSLRQKADQSSTVLEGAVSSMTHIRNAASQIEEIVEVVNEIAFKTNLLSLNAAIEAARAGDSVKGFTVVANSIRELSKQTAEALAVIKHHTSETVKTVEAGQDAVNASVSFISQLIGDFRSISASMENISTLISEHLLEVESIDHSIIAAGGYSEKAAKMVENILLVSKQLEDETARLKREVEKISDS